MSTFKDKAKAQFRDKLTERGEFYVDAWETTVYFKPLTLKEMSEIASRSNGADLDIIAENVIARCLDADGNKLFRRAEKIELMREYDPDVLSDIVIEAGKFDASIRGAAGN